MVFISKNINFTWKTNFSKEKNIRNAFLQWKRWCLSGKIEILPRKGTLLKKKYYKCRFTVENMVFISKNISFTSKTNFSTEEILEMQFYSLKDGFYQEKQKFYLEKEVFIYRKNFINAVFQWKICFLSVKT